MKHLILFLFCFLAVAVTAQSDSARVDSVAKAIEATWMQPRGDGQIWHSLPPPQNVVTAGTAIEAAAHMGRDAMWLRLATTAVGAVMWTQNKNVGYAIAGAGWGYSLVLEFRKFKSLGEAGRLLQSGYSINKRYELMPDDMGPDELRRLKLKGK